MTSVKYNQHTSNVTHTFFHDSVFKNILTKVHKKCSLCKIILMCICTQRIESIKQLKKQRTRGFLNDTNNDQEIIGSHKSLS